MTKKMTISIDTPKNRQKRANLIKACFDYNFLSIKTINISEEKLPLAKKLVFIDDKILVFFNDDEFIQVRPIKFS